MSIIAFIQNIFVSLLVGYIGLTNSLATYIGHFTPPEKTGVSVAQPKEKTFAEKFNQAVAEAERFSNTVPRILLDNSAFQNAALIASTRDEHSENATDTQTLSSDVEKALVNVYCQYKTDTYTRTTTGSGFFINQKGIILTNAHVAQFLLLKNTKGVINDVECVIREGNPAKPKYHAELLYISPKWIVENADLINSESPRGTGERDYALLYVSESIDGTPLPSRFPAITPDTDLLSRSVVGTEVLSGGYPAEKLIRNGPDAELSPVIAKASIGTLYTFGSNYADIFSISDSPVGEQGASGGPVVHPDDGAIGLIVTKGDTATEGEHSLRALTLSYIDRTMSEETRFSLAQNMLGDVALRGNIFREAIGPFLTKTLTDELRN